MFKRSVVAALLASAFAAPSAIAATITQNGVLSLSNTANLAIGDDVTFFESLSPVDGKSLYSFTFTATQPLKVSFIAMAASGASSGADINKVRFGFDNPPTGTYTIANVSPGGSTSAIGSLPEFVLNTGEAFSVFFAETAALAKSVGATNSFTVSAIPLPASVTLFLSALTGLAVLQWRGRRSGKRSRSAAAA